MGKKLLIADDSALMRRLLSDIMKKDGRFSVIDTAVNGKQAFQMIIHSPDYDILLLDVNMPEMDGISLLQHLAFMKEKPMVIIVSSLAKEGAATTIKALEYGAFDFVTKPEATFDVTKASFQEHLKMIIGQALEERSKDTAVSGEKTEGRIGTEAKRAGQKRNPPRAEAAEVSIDDTESGTVSGIRGNHDSIVVIASSTGGPKALQSVLPQIAAGIDAPILLVQHMPEGFTKSLADRLDELSQVKVMEAMDGMRLEKGVVYIAKGGHQMHLSLDKKGVYRLIVNKDEARGGLRPCADILLESMLPYCFSTCTCVVLTGMGADATKGIMQLYNKYKKNIYIIAQDAATCTVYGMPKAIADKGIVNEVLPLEQISDAIVKHVGVR